MSPPPDPRPRLAAGLGAFAIGDARGSLTWVREARGAPMDWGGVYAQGVRLTGPWATEYSEGGLAVLAIPSSAADERPGSFGSVVDEGRFRVEGRVIVPPDGPRVLIERRISRRDGTSAEVRITTEFAPFLAPVLLEGVRPHEFLAEVHGPSVVFEAGGFVGVVDSDRPARELRLNGVAWSGARRRGPLRRLTLVHDVPVPAGSVAVHRLVLTGGRKAAVRTGSVPADAGTWADRAEAAVRDWEARTPLLGLPAAPDLERAYGLARRALRSLYTAPEAGFFGLVAGYPWYAALWCRDLARMLPAVLWMGDGDWAARSLETVFRYQAPHRYPLLAAEAGELPMQVSPGPIFLYGTSDTSLYYPDLVRRYLGHTGDGGRTEPWLPRLERIRRWAEAKVDPSTGLYRNGGELAELRTASASTGHVHLGIDATDTTIWDSADRRDHANDLQLLWIQVLRSLGRLSDRPGAPAGWRSLGARADGLAASVAGRYRWAAETYLFDSLRDDGSPVARVRPNALQWVGEGLLGADEERAIVARARRDDLTTDWGLRTLSALDPDYDPMAYHMGQVWPIASAWLARAAFAVGDADLGVEGLRRAAGPLLAEGGFANECYRGDRPEPFDSCFLLGFSVAPLLAAFFEGLWGLSLDAPAGVVTVDPRRPAAWPEMSLRRLSVGAGRLDLRAVPDRLEARWTGPGPLVLAGPQRSMRIAPGDSGSLDLGARQAS